MNIVLKFDYYSPMVYVPDGYIKDISELQAHFFEWLHDKSEYFAQDKSGNLAFSYDENAVLKYINDVVLEHSNEKAYFISKPTKGDVYTIKF